MVNFINLKKRLSILKPELEKAISEVIDNSRFVLGKQVKEFENEFASFCNVPFSIGVGNGTQAIELCLRAFNIGIGDKVIIPVNTSFFTALGVFATGAEPIFIDIDPETMTIDSSKIEEALCLRTKAIIPVHFYGHPADMDQILRIAKKYNLKVIEDACQAHGAKYKGKVVGSIGDAGCFSFYETKNLGALGDGGAITTNNEELDKKLRILRNGGNKGGHVHKYISINSRLDEMQAAILRIQLKHLEKWNNKRREIAKKYKENMKNVTHPVTKDFVEHVFHLYVIRTPHRNNLKEYLKDKGITTLIHYPKLIHKQEVFGEKYASLSFPIAEKYNKEILSIPIYPELTNEEIEQIIYSINSFQDGKI
jgi:dTDP-4-amino-4,6-dideoxygalactose transaminase